MFDMYKYKYIKLYNKTTLKELLTYIYYQLTDFSSYNIILKYNKCFSLDFSY